MTSITHAILDTHTLVWFLDKSPRLGKKALSILLDDQIVKIVPLIVLCEIHYLHKKKRFTLSLEKLLQLMEKTQNFESYPHHLAQIPYLNAQLEIHDALIVAATLEFSANNHQKVVILSRDSQIQRCKEVTCLW